MSTALPIAAAKVLYPPWNIARAVCTTYRASSGPASAVRARTWPSGPAGLPVVVNQEATSSLSCSRARRPGSTRSGLRPPSMLRMMVSDTCTHADRGGGVTPSRSAMAFRATGWASSRITSHTDCGARTSSRAAMSRRARSCSAGRFCACGAVMKADRTAA